MPSLTKLRVDFDDVAHDDLLPSYSGTQLQVGLVVVLVDGDGNSCLGSVARMDADGTVWLSVAWQYWIPVGIVPVHTTGTNEADEPFVSATMGPSRVVIYAPGRFEANSTGEIVPRVRIPA